MKSIYGKLLLPVVFLVIFNACYNGKPQNNMEEQSITVMGIARNGKDGALISTQEDSVYYIEGLEFWEASLNGKEISVTGVLHIESSSVDEMKNEKDEWKAGVVGDKKIIRSAKWKVVEK